MTKTIFDKEQNLIIVSDLNDPSAVSLFKRAGHEHLDMGLELNKEKSFKFINDNIETIGDDLIVMNKPHVEFTNLRSIGKDIQAQYTPIFIAPKLETVQGYIDISGIVNVDLPSLKSVGGEIWAFEAETVNLPSLIDCPRLYAFKAKEIHTSMNGIIFGPKDCIYDCPNAHMIYKDDNLNMQNGKIAKQIGYERWLDYDVIEFVLFEDLKQHWFFVQAEDGRQGYGLTKEEALANFGEYGADRVL